MPLQRMDRPEPCLQEEPEAEQDWEEPRIWAVVDLRAERARLPVPASDERQG